MTFLRQCRYLLRHERPVPWALVVLLALLVTMIEAVGALLIFLLVALVSSPAGTVDLPLFGDIRQFQGGLSSEAFVAWVAVGVAAFFALRAVLLVTQVYVQDRLAHNAGARLSVRVLSGYLRMPYLWHLRRNSAEFIRNAYESVRAVTGEVLIPSVRLVSNLALAAGMFAVLLITAPMATALAAFFLVPIVVVLLKFIQPRLKRLGRRRQRLARESLSLLQQSLHGVREVKVFGRERFFVHEFGKRQRASARVSYLHRVAMEIPQVLVETTLVVFIAGFFVITVVFQGETETGLAVLGLFAYAALRLQPAVHKIVQSLNSIRFAGAAVDNIYADLKAIEDSESSQPIQVTEMPEGVNSGHVLRLEGVEFRYTEDSLPAITGIDLEIAPGESVGVVGPTGGGKSTLIDVMTGLLSPTSGRVLIDDIDLRTCTDAWQRKLGVVSQTVFLLDDTLRRNIAIGLPDREIKDSRISEAVRLAQLQDFVESLPTGLETRLGERGVRLSGGQRQRVAIARALYRQPSVLIFDEGTSALDNVTEAEFLAALSDLRGRLTLITVAHRLTTVKSCDRILVIAGGRVADSGSYEELVIDSETFARLASEAPTAMAVNRQLAE